MIPIHDLFEAHLTVSDLADPGGELPVKGESYVAGGRSVVVLVNRPV